MHFTRYILLCLLAFAIVSCGKKETATNSPSSNMTVDTTKKAEPVAITDTSHHLFFRPKIGSVQRYHVVDRITMNASDTPPGTAPTKSTTTSFAEIYLHQTIKSARKDSSVELVIHVDSITVTSTRDTSKTTYSSSNLKDRMNNQFQEYNLVLGKDFTVLANKYGDLDSVLDVSSLTNTLLATAPDSIRSNPQIVNYAKMQSEQIANAYIMRVFVHSPTRALKQDTTWRTASDVNLDIAPNLFFPVHITASETVRGLENRDGAVLAVLEDSTITVPNKTTMEDAGSKVSINNFTATSHSIVRIEDATGLLFHRAMNEKRSFTLVAESKQPGGAKRTVTQNGNEELITERLQ